MRLAQCLRRPGLVAAAVLLAGAYAPGAQAASSQALTISVPTAGASSCALTDDGQVYERVGTFGGAQSTFVLQLDPAAAAGTYAVSLTCGTTSENVQITVPESQSRIAGNPLFNGYAWTTGHPAALASSTLSAGAADWAGPYSTAASVPHMTPMQRRAAFDAWLRRQNPSDYAAATEAELTKAFAGSGQCTTLADAMRPDIVKAIIVGIYARWMTSSPNFASAPEIDNWDAGNWANLAREGGVPTGSTPRPGALMVFHSDDPAAWPGHVAYVDSVSGGLVYVTQEHAPQLGVVTQGVYPDQAVIEISGQSSAVSYIY